MLAAQSLVGLLLGPAPGKGLVLAAGPQLSLQDLQFAVSPMAHTELQRESGQSYTNLVLAPGDVGRAWGTLCCCPCAWLAGQQ